MFQTAVFLQEVGFCFFIFQAFSRISRLPSPRYRPRLTNQRRLTRLAVISRRVYAKTATVRPPACFIFNSEAVYFFMIATSVCSQRRRSPPAALSSIIPIRTRKSLWQRSSGCRSNFRARQQMDRWSRANHLDYQLSSPFVFDCSKWQWKKPSRANTSPGCSGSHVFIIILIISIIILIIMFVLICSTFCCFYFSSCFHCYYE